MPDPSDLLRHDGARWRAEVDAHPPLDVGPLLEGITSDPVLPTVLPSRPGRFAGRTAQLLSLAAVTAAALAVGAGALAVRAHTHPAAHPAAGVTAPAVVPALPPAAASSGNPSRATGSTTAAPRVDGAKTAGAPSPAPRHRTRTTAPRAPAASNSAPPALPACVDADLGISVSTPASSAGHGTLTVSVLNRGAAACTITGFPTIRFSGDVSAAAGAEIAMPQTLAGGVTAAAAVNWDVPSDASSCPSYDSVLVGAPGGSPRELALAPSVQVCDASTLVSHPLQSG